MKFEIVVAASYPDFGIGYENGLPWYIKEDLKKFKETTTKTLEDDSIKYINAVIMGRNTWDSIPKKPLGGRLNIIITSNPNNYKSESEFVTYCKWEDLENEILSFNEKHYKDEGKIVQIYNNFIIGGDSIYKLALKDLYISKIYLTEVYQKEVYDTYFPKIYDDDRFVLSECSKFNSYEHELTKKNRYYRYLLFVNKDENNGIENEYKNNEELNYLNVMGNILENGIERCDRTGVGTLSLFGLQLKYDLSDTFPLCTTKKLALRWIFEELMLYLRGQTDNKILNDKKITIWNGNTSKEFLEKRGLPYREGDMGETYGFNFRHFGGDYKGCDGNYEGQGFDQLNEVIRLIKEDPTSRRIIINLWNPDGNQRAALPSCLCMYQFYVDTINKKLNLQIYIRSSDYFLANNWNTCTGALFVHMICNLEGIELSPGELTVVIGDAHLYKTHLDAVRTNLERKPNPFPKLVINCKKKKDITKFEYSDFDLIGYRAQSSIKAEMAV